MKTSIKESGPSGFTYAPQQSASPDLELLRAREAPLGTAGAADVTIRTYAGVNLRNQMLRGLLRVVVLLLSDLTAFLLLRAVLRALRQWQGLGSGDPHFIQWLFAQGYLGGWQFAAALLISLVLVGTYGPGDNRRMPTRLFTACALGTALPLWASLWSQPLLLTAGRYALTVPPTFVMLLTFRLGLDRVILRFAPHPHAAAQARTVLIGRSADCVEVRSSPAMGPAAGFRLLGFVDVQSPPAPGALGSVTDLDQILVEHRVDTLILCGSHEDQTVVQLMRAALTAECQVLTSARRYRLAGVRPQVLWRRGYPFIALRTAGLRWQQLMLKRMLDVVVSGIALVLLSPVMLAIGAAIRLESPGPAIFRQRRLRRHGQPFDCNKFRSMYVDAEQRLRGNGELHRLYVENGYKLPEALDTRVTRVGRFLRRTSLDELPQLWNVLKGDMSLVGPRPIVPDEIRHYSESAPLLLMLKPGLTGAWQVNGRSLLRYPERATVELEYVERWSLLSDLWILIRTVPAVLGRRGAH